MVFGSELFCRSYLPSYLLSFSLFLGPPGCFVDGPPYLSRPPEWLETQAPQTLIVGLSHRSHSEAKLTSTIDVVSQMCRGMAPPTFDDDDSFMAELRKKFDNFPIYELVTGTGANKRKERLVGLKALKAQVVALQKRQNVTLADLEMLTVLRGRLSEEDQNEVSKLIENAVASAGGGAAKASSSSSQAAASAPPASGDKGDKNTTKKRVAGFFA